MSQQPVVPAFESPEGLRKLLIRLHESGPSSWHADPEARDLAIFVARKYARLARKHRLDPWEAVGAAFEAMQKRSTRKADNPWAVVTRAVKLACMYEERAHGLLCSFDQARDADGATHHDAERFADRDQALLQYHPAFQVPAISGDAEEEAPGPVKAAILQAVTQSVTNSVTVFCLLGWPLQTAQETIDYMCHTLARMGNRASAIEALRHDHQARAMVDLGRKPWNTAIKVLLGTANPAYAATRIGRGLLMRLVLGETLEQVFADDDLVRKVSAAAPTLRGLP